MKINVDRAFLHPLTLGGVGRVIQNSLGQFIAGFAYRKAHMAIKNGIELQQAMEILVAKVHSDYLLAVQAIQSDEEDLSPLGNLIEDVKGLLPLSPQIYIQHASRTTNHEAHKLASYIALIQKFMLNGSLTLRILF